MHRLQNYTQADYASNSSSGQKRKRARQTLSCRACRLRKVACDREQPCGNCVKQSKHQDCIYGADNGSNGDSGQWSLAPPPPNQQESSSNGPLIRREPSSAESRMERRMERLELMVQGLATKIEAREDGIGVPRRASTAITPRSAVNDQSCKDATGESVQVGERTSIYSKGIFSMKQPGTIYYIGRSGYTTVHQQNVSCCQAHTLTDAEVEAGTLPLQLARLLQNSMGSCRQTSASFYWMAQTSNLGLWFSNPSTG